jgi:hypothetical protein
VIQDETSISPTNDLQVEEIDEEKSQGSSRRNPWNPVATT